jgi:hypothetical protein
LIACRYFTAGWHGLFASAGLSEAQALLRRARRQKTEAEATRAFCNDSLFFDFEILVDVFAFDAQFARSLAIRTRNALETHG